MIGKTISHYKILAKLGEGGMGVVYKAEDTKLERTVTLKFLSSQLVGSGSEKIRFIHEARVAAALDHPNICTVYEIDEVDNQTFIAMAYCEGVSLEEKVQTGPLGLDEALVIGLQVARGLESAHQKGIIHRDIKSSNIMLTTDGQAKIMDFGLAKMPDQTKITKSGTTVGTISYMSPEQARGEEIDARSDLFSLGVVLYEILTGRLPFRGSHETAVLYSIMQQEPDSLAKYRDDAPEALQQIIDKALQKEAGTRYQGASELIEDLKRVVRRVRVSRYGISSLKASDQTSRFRPYKRLMVPFVVFVLAAMLLLVPSNWDAFKNILGLSGIPDQKHLVVLPFTNIGGDPQNEAFCDGLIETMTCMLTQLERFQGALWVVPASEVRQLEVKSAKEAKQEFGVNLAVTGSVQRFEDKFLLTLNLVDTKTLRQLRSQIIEDLISNIAVLQDETIIRVAQMLEVELSPQTRSILTAGGTAVPGAYEFYLEGRGYLRRYEDLENVESAIALFEKGVEKDPLYAQAYAGLGEAYWYKYELLKEAELVDRAKFYCNRAIEINEQLAPVHITLAIIHRGTGRYEKAIAELEHALRLDPASFDATLELAMVYRELRRNDEAEAKYKEAINMKPDYWGGYNKLGVFYYRNGRLEDAEKMFRKATELTPDNIRGYNNLIGIYYMLGNAELAMEMFEESIAIKPNLDAYTNMSAVYIYLGRYADAIPLLEEAINMGVNEYRIWANLADSYRYTPEYADKAPEAYQRVIQLAKAELEINPNDAILRSILACYYAKSGDHKSALAEIMQARNQAPNDIVVLYKCVLVHELASQREQALKSLEKALEEGMSTEELQNDPELVELRKDPLYQQLINK